MQSLLNTALMQLGSLSVPRVTILIAIVMVLGTFSLGASFKDLLNSPKSEMLEFIRVNLLVLAVFALEVVSAWFVLTIGALLR